MYRRLLYQKRGKILPEMYHAFYVQNVLLIDVADAKKKVWSNSKVKPAITWFPKGPAAFGPSGDETVEHPIFVQR